MLKIEVTNRFKKDLDEAIKRGCKYSNLQIILEYLSSETRLPDKYKDHCKSQLQNVGCGYGFSDCTRSY